MSSNSGGNGRVGVGLSYFCYTCNGTGFTPYPIPDDFLCPTCHGTFVLIYIQSRNPNPNNNNNNLPVPISRGGGITRQRRFIWRPSGQRVHHHQPVPPIAIEFFHRFVLYMIASGASAEVIRAVLHRIRSGGGGGGRGSVSGSTGGTSRENPHRPGSMKLRLKSLLRWPFRACGSPAETTNNNNNNGNQSSRGGEN